MNHRADECPDLETIAVYLEGRLTDRARARVAEHLAGCETCYFVFSEAAQMGKARATTPVDELVGVRSFIKGWRRSRVTWKTAAAALATAACLMLAVQVGIVSWRTSDAPELRTLVAAVGSERPIEGRLSGGFAYGPLRGATRAGDGTTEAISPDVRIAAAEIEKKATERRTPQTLSALGIAYLVEGDITRAVAVLEEAADQPNPDPRILNDLAAAYLARATRDNQVQDFAKALTFAERVVAANPRLPEGWFNRAYALERLSLAEQARRAWEDYLKVDDRSGWAGEARRHLARLALERF